MYDRLDKAILGAVSKESRTPRYNKIVQLEAKRVLSVSRSITTWGRVVDTRVQKLRRDGKIKYRHRKDTGYFEGWVLTEEGKML
jgi:hypothetical protein